MLNYLGKYSTVPPIPLFCHSSSVSPVLRIQTRCQLHTNGLDLSFSPYAVIHHKRELSTTFPLFSSSNLVKLTATTRKHVIFAPKSHQTTHFPHWLLTHFFNIKTTRISTQPYTTHTSTTHLKHLCTRTHTFHATHKWKHSHSHQSFITF